MSIVLTDDKKFAGTPRLRTIHGRHPDYRLQERRQEYETVVVVGATVLLAVVLVALRWFVCWSGFQHQLACARFVDRDGTQSCRTQV